MFESWQQPGPDLRVVAIDLHAGLDIATARTEDYVRQVIAALENAPGPAALCGWSMGGLVAMAAATRWAVDSLVLLEPSPPAETQGRDPSVGLSSGTFDPEEVYGTFPPGVRARPESATARAERKRGISIPRLPARALVIYGDEFPDERGRAIAKHYGCEEHHLRGLDHWGLVLDERVPSIAFDFVRAPAVNR